MKHADKIIERILFLEGLPNLQHLGKLYIGQHTQVLHCDVRKVKENIEVIQQTVALAETQMDYVTRDLVREILKRRGISGLDYDSARSYRKCWYRNYIQSQL